MKNYNVSRDEQLDKFRIELSSAITAALIALGEEAKKLSWFSEKPAENETRKTA